MTDVPPVTPPAPLAPGARCAIHPDLAAESTCLRCGNFMCRTCVGDGSLGLCLACQHRTGSGPFPFDREHYSLDDLFKHAVARFKQHWLPLVAATGGFMIIVYVAAFAAAFALASTRPAGSTANAGPLSPSFFLLQILQSLIQTVPQIPLFALCLDVAAGGEPAAGAAFRRLRRLPAVLLQMLIVLLVVGLFFGMLGALGFTIAKLTGTSAHPPWFLFAAGALIALIPVAYLGIGVMFSMLELLYNPDASAIDALRTSFMLVEGQRWPALGIALLSGLLACAGALACCVGMFASMPLGLLLYCSLFLALRNDRSSGR